MLQPDPHRLDRLEEVTSLAGDLHELYRDVAKSLQSSEIRDRMPLWPFVRQTPPRTAPGQRLYVIGDVHGRLDLLDRKIDAVCEDLRQHPHPDSRLIFLGDYVDRGPASAQVVERLLHLDALQGTIFLKGNHEVLLERALDDPGVIIGWCEWGGLETLHSYGVTPRIRPSPDDCPALARELAAAVPSRHRAFFAGLPLTHVSGDYVFVHAGLRPGLPLVDQSADDLLWIRDEFLTHSRPFEKFVVHGHTPVMEPDARRNRINIDTGAYATGRLTCLVLEDASRRYV